MDSHFHADMIHYQQTPGTLSGASSYTAQLCLRYYYYYYYYYYYFYCNHFTALWITNAEDRIHNLLNILVDES